MVAGEYAVLEPGQKAVVAAVNRYVTVCVERSLKNQLFLPQLGLENIGWNINDEKIQLSVRDSRLGFIQNSISVMSRFLQEKYEALYPCLLQIKSELDDPSTGKKYGLGSSAAVVTAVIFAIINLHNSAVEAVELEHIFKLAAIAHVKTQKSGSGADIAAAVYGGWLEYSAFSAKWLLDELDQGKKISELVEEDWPNLSIRTITPPTALRLAVGWTKEAVSTAPMIESVHNFRDHNLELYNEFLRESSCSVAELIQSFEKNNCEKAIKSLTKNRRALQRLGKNAGITIETAKLKTLCSIAENFGSGKSSGAGGGDCGIAFLKGETQRQELYKAWEAADISPLDLKVSYSGVSTEEIN